MLLASAQGPGIRTDHRQCIEHAIPGSGHFDVFSGTGFNQGTVAFSVVFIPENGDP
jgi:hypothetical protein